VFHKVNNNEETTCPLSLWELSQFSVIKQLYKCVNETCLMENGWVMVWMCEFHWVPESVKGYENFIKTVAPDAKSLGIPESVYKSLQVMPPLQSLKSAFPTVKTSFTFEETCRLSQFCLTVFGYVGQMKVKGEVNTNRHFLNKWERFPLTEIRSFPFVLEENE